jgi:hypothetical protein
MVVYTVVFTPSPKGQLRIHGSNNAQSSFQELNLYRSRSPSDSVTFCFSHGCLSVTCTGRSFVFAPLPNRPSRYSFRQWNTRFAFTSWRRATRDTDAPGCKVASTILRRRSSTLRRRFFAPTILTLTSSFDVSTIPLRGHKQKCPQRPSSSTTPTSHRRFESDVYKERAQRDCSLWAFVLCSHHYLDLLGQQAADQS